MTYCFLGHHNAANRHIMDFYVSNCIILNNSIYITNIICTISRRTFLYRMRTNRYENISNIFLIKLNVLSLLLLTSCINYLKWINNIISKRISKKRRSCSIITLINSNHITNFTKHIFQTTNFANILVNISSININIFLNNNI